MLIEFRVANYKSIGEEQVLSLVPASKQKEHSENILQKGKHQALNAVAIYGANASGKSNLLKAMGMLKKLINFSARSSSTTKLPYDPFLLREDWINKPTFFEIVFLIAEDRYRYGVEFNENEIVSEWLFRKSVGREVNLFQRSQDTIDVSSGFKGSSKTIDAAIEATRDNALFLSTCDMLNIEEAKNILHWFEKYIITDGLNTEHEIVKTISLWDDEEYRQKIKEYFTSLNFGIIDLDITTQDLDLSGLPEQIPNEFKNFLINKLTGAKKYTVYSTHRIYDSKCQETKNLQTWDLGRNESPGTQKAFELSGPILWTLMNGGILIIDEIEGKLHPIMTLHTINMFLNNKTNPNHAQLIFATHDTNLLSYANLRRDQIYFTEKNNWEATEFYSLSDFTYMGKKNGISEKERPDTDKEKRYFEGRYGAIPVLGNFNPVQLKSNGKER